MRKTTFLKSEKSNLPTVNATKEIAAIAGVGHDTVAKVKKICGHGRRNLLPYIRTKLALELEETISARSKQGTRTDLCQISDNSSPLDTKRELATIAGVSHDTVAKVKKIEAKAIEKLAETNPASAGGKEST